MSRKRRNNSPLPALTPDFGAATQPAAPNARETASTVMIQAAEIDRLNAVIKKRDRRLSGAFKQLTVMRQCLSTMNSLLLVPHLPSPKGSTTKERK
jgi:hypothetical protein